ncbi:MAG: hypothetical protein L0J06_03670, partial [Yaniella sp.]|nr:hypothetical protein [Yaniella sp.]
MSELEQWEVSLAAHILRELDDVLTEQRALYRDLHQHPEPSMQEHQTAERIEAELGKLDVEVQRIGGTGVGARGGHRGRPPGRGPAGIGGFAGWGP